MGRRSRSHTVTGPGGRFQCTHCGATSNPFPEDGSGAELVAFVEAATAFADKHDGCPKPERPRCYFCLSQEHATEAHVNATTRTPEDWPGCGDTGTSSEAIWAQMMHQLTPAATRREGTHPSDSQDFACCCRLLAAPWASGWRARIGEMAALGLAWVRIADAWDELEALYLAEVAGGPSAPLYNRLKALATRGSQ